MGYDLRVHRIFDAVNYKIITISYAARLLIRCHDTMDHTMTYFIPTTYVGDKGIMGTTTFSRGVK